MFGSGTKGMSTVTAPSRREEPTPPIGRARFEHPKTAGVHARKKQPISPTVPTRSLHMMRWRQTRVGLKQPSTPAEKAAVINNVGFLLHDAFTHAKRLGIKTALGTESPLAFEPGNAQVNDEGDPAHIITEDWIRTCPSYVRDRMKHVHGFAIPTSRGPDNEAFAKASTRECSPGSCERIHWIIFGMDIRDVGVWGTRSFTGSNRIGC